MEKKFEGVVLNGFLMLFASLVLMLASIVAAISGIVLLADGIDEANGTALLVGGLTAFVASIIMLCGFLMLEPNEARVITWFGKYAGTEIKVDGEPRLIIREEDILAIVE